MQFEVGNRTRVLSTQTKHAWENQTRYISILLNVLGTKISSEKSTVPGFLNRILRACLHGRRVTVVSGLTLNGRAKDSPRLQASFHW